MVDSDEFIETTPSGSLQSIKVGELASRLTSSYLLALFAGVATFVYAVFEVPALLIEDLFEWIRETLGLGFAVPEHTYEYAWDVVADIFPIAGPFDYALGVLLILVFFIAIRWMFDRVTGGL